MVAYGQGEYARALAHLEPALLLARRARDAFNIAQALFYVGLIACEGGELAKAAASVEEALALVWASGDREGLARCLANLAVLAVACRRSEPAARFLGAVESLREEIGLLPFAFPERVAYERAQAITRARLGEPALGAAWAAGRARAPEQTAADVEAVLAAAAAPSARADQAGLIPRELDVLRLIAAGRSNPEIAAALFVSPRTVTTHVTNIFTKLGLDSRAAAAAYAVRHGLA